MNWIEKLFYRLLRRRGLADGQVMPWWAIAINCAIHPRWLLVNVLGPAVSPVSYDPARGCLVIDGTLYSLYFFRHLRNRGDKPVLAQKCSPDVPFGETWLVIGLPGAETSGTIRV